jgi:biopolymer transport protein ExbD
MKRPMSHPRLRSDINMAPLVDIVLVLLIVFIVLVPGMVRATQVALPIKGGETEAPPLVVTLDAEGSWCLQSAETTPAQLTGSLCQAVQRQPMGFRKVFLKVHPALPHHRVVAALDAIREAGERAKRETRAKPEWLNQDGGDIRVVTGLMTGS